MLQLNNIYKKYGPSYAVQDLSFKISSGEVVGFLGPNGAGKSTTMRIISGCTGPSEGELLIDAISATPHTRETKRKIGYLPENPPLYPNMTVTDYLLFCASIKGVSNTTSATKRVLSLCSLEEYAHSFISTLSKGYQQRVGLAQALIHKPRLLILDEPTSGLDPEQRIEFRTLIKNLSKGDLTVLLSTHILSEIETICDRVIIIADGSIVAQDTLHNLKSMEQRVRIQTQKDPSELCTQLKNHSKITKVFPLDNYEIEIEYTEEIRTEIASMATPFGLIVLKQATTLEDVYLRLITKTK
jgi:ABC-2 type transport system ATP-binding protein